MGLVNLGIKPGDHVALSCPNLPYFPMVYYGILKAGAVVVTLNVLLKPREIAYHLQDSDAKAFFCFEGTAELPMGQMGKTAFDAAPAMRHLIVITANPASPITHRRRQDIGSVDAQPAVNVCHPYAAGRTIPQSYFTPPEPPVSLKGRS